MLIRYVWPWAKRDVLQHDSYSCHKFSGNVIGFPTQRKNEVQQDFPLKLNMLSLLHKLEWSTLSFQSNNFVASVHNEKMYMYDECPKKCRRREEWTRC